jgi:hypothetical protein
MSAFYDLASLVVVPSGYKSGKIYAQKPLTTDGQLTFTRSNDTATRVASNGLIEKVRTNLLTYSNTFSNAAWAKDNGATVTAGQSGYDGSTNAWKLEAPTAGASRDIFQIYSASAPLTFSVYAKAGSTDWIRINLSGIGNQYFNLANGTAGSGSGIPYSITPAGNGYYRISISGLTGSIGSVYIFLASGDVDINVSAGDNIYIQNAQLETGDIATEPILTTSAAVSVGPVANVPRLDYLGSSCPRLLLEPQRTNSCLWSEQIDNAGWSKTRASVTANAETSPDGYTNADAIIADSVNDDHFVGQNISVTNATAYSFSAFLKKGNKNWARLWNTSVGYADFDLTNGVVGTQSSATGSIENFGNGWYRCTILYTASSTSAQAHRIYTLEGDNNKTFAGNGLTTNLYVYGAQLEAGSYATSYCPTLGAVVTRGADVASKTGISSLIGQTEGTLYWEGRIVEGVGTDLFIAGDITNSIFFNITSSNSLRIGIRANGTLVLSPSGGTVATNNKIALAYKSGDVVAYVNGVQVITDSTSFTFSDSISKIELARAFFDAKATQLTAQALLFKTRLSNADLAALTA